jgi:hypothetical protein
MLRKKASKKVRRSIWGDKLKQVHFILIRKVKIKYHHYTRYLTFDKDFSSSSYFSGSVTIRNGKFDWAFVTQKPCHGFFYRDFLSNFDRTFVSDICRAFVTMFCTPYTTRLNDLYCIKKQDICYEYSRLQISFKSLSAIHP